MQNIVHCTIFKSIKNEACLRIFKVKIFARFTKKAGLSDGDLVKAIEQAEKGLIDADLGGGLIKQRVSRKGQGKSGGFRTIIAFRTKAKAFFLHGFAKNEFDNIENNELESLKNLAKAWFKANDQEIRQAILRGLLEEVHEKKIK